MRSRLIGALITVGVLHRIEDAELVVLAVDEETVDRVASNVSRGLADKVTGQTERRQKDLPALLFVEPGAVQHRSEAISPPASQERAVSGPPSAHEGWAICPSCHQQVQWAMYQAHLASCTDEEVSSRADVVTSANGITRDGLDQAGTYKGVVTSAYGRG